MLIHVFVSRFYGFPLFLPHQKLLITGNYIDFSCAVYSFALFGTFAAYRSPSFCCFVPPLFTFPLNPIVRYFSSFFLLMIHALYSPVIRYVYLSNNFSNRLQIYIHNTIMFYFPVLSSFFFSPTLPQATHSKNTPFLHTSSLFYPNDVWEALFKTILHLPSRQSNILSLQKYAQIHF